MSFSEVKKAMDRDELLKELAEVITESFYTERYEALMCSGEERVLLLIEKAGGTVYPKQLSDALGVTMPRITTILNSIDKKEFIVRKTAEDDRRKVEVSITKKGRTAVRKRKKMIEEYVSAVMADATDAELKAVLKFIHHANEVRNVKNAVD